MSTLKLTAAQGLCYAIQGELCGPGIAKNHLGLTEPDLFVFNVWSCERNNYLAYHEYQEFCTVHGLRTVPLLGVCSDTEIFESASGDQVPIEYNLPWFLRLAEGKYVGTQNNREGIVVRPLIEQTSTTLNGRFSFKVLNNIFLLKDES